MQILTKEKIKEAIVHCKPRQIAVAYIGIDWRAFIPDTSDLEAVIVSPTLGSNPKAILTLEKAIGWNKLLFINELHAKIYLGQESAVVGSANLTKNGLSGQSLIELCVKINSETDVRKIGNILDDLKKRAQDQYPTTETKKARIKELERIWNAAFVNEIFPPPPPPPGEQDQFADFELLAEDHFYVVWYQPADCEYSDEVKALEKSVMVDDIHFAQPDKVEKNKWVLVWQITNSLKPHKSIHPHWLYIHDIFEGGIVEEGYEYPKCAIQRSDMRIPSPPFEITKELESAFKNAVIENGIAEYLIQDDREVFSLEHSLKGIPTLLSKMKQYMANNANSADAKNRRG